MTIAPIGSPKVTDRRPRPLRRFAALVALVVTLATPGLTLAWSPNAFSSTDEALLVKLTNQARASAGLPALKVDATLTSVARWRSQDMIDRDYFSHSIPPNGTKVFDELKRIGYCYTAAGENIGTNNYPDDVATQTIQDGFMGSSGHRANILGTWAVIGIGAYKGADGKHVWTVLFANKCGSSPAPTPKPTSKPKPPATPRPVVKATPAPTPLATATPDVTAVPDALDPAELLGALGGRLGGLPAGFGTAGPGPATSPRPVGNPIPAEDADRGLQVVDPAYAGSLVDTIVGDVAGAYFGR